MIVRWHHTCRELVVPGEKNQRAERYDTHRLGVEGTSEAEISA